MTYCILAGQLLESRERGPSGPEDKKKKKRVNDLERELARVEKLQRKPLRFRAKYFG